MFGEQTLVQVRTGFSLLEDKVQPRPWEHFLRSSWADWCRWRLWPYLTSTPHSPDTMATAANGAGPAPIAVQIDGELSLRPTPLQMGAVPGS